MEDTAKKRLLLRKIIDQLDFIDPEDRQIFCVSADKFDRSRNLNDCDNEAVYVKLIQLDQAILQTALRYLTAIQAGCTDDAEDIKKMLKGMWSLCTSILSDPTPTTILNLKFEHELESADKLLQNLELTKSHVSHAHDSAATRKRMRVVENIPVQNKYAALPSDVPAEIHTNENSAEIANNMDTSAPEPAKKTPIKPRVESIFVPLMSNWPQFIEELKSVALNPVRGRVSGEMLRITAHNIDDYRCLQQYFVQKGIPFHALAPRDERPAKILIRGLPLKTDITILSDHIAHLGYQVRSLVQLRNRKTKHLMPLFVANISSTPGWESILKLDLLISMEVTITKFITRGLKQCYRCQGFNHSSHTCTMPAKCVKCAGDHLTNSCTKTPEPPPKCCHCLGAHPASYRGCPANPKNRQKAINNKNKENKKHIDAPIPSTNAWTARAAAKQPTNDYPTLPQTSTNQSTPQESASAQPENNTNLPKKGKNGSFRALSTFFGDMDVRGIFETFRGIKGRMKAVSSPIDKIYILLESVDFVFGAIFGDDDD